MTLASALEYINGDAMMLAGLYMAVSIAASLVRSRTVRYFIPKALTACGLFMHGFHHVILGGTVIGELSDLFIWTGILSMFWLANRRMARKTA